jgi:death-on-curing protein
VRYLTLAEVLELHRRVMEQAGGSPAVRDLGGLISAVAQPRVTFEGHDLHPTAADKAAALCVSIIVNHPFVDGNKRAGHAAMETFLVMNGYEVVASVDESEQVMLDVASGRIDRERLAAWLQARIVTL